MCSVEVTGNFWAQHMTHAHGKMTGIFRTFTLYESWTLDLKIKLKYSGFNVISRLQWDFNEMSRFH